MKKLLTLFSLSLSVLLLVSCAKKTITNTTETQTTVPTTTVEPLTTTRNDEDENKYQYRKMLQSLISYNGTTFSTIQKIGYSLDDDYTLIGYLKIGIDISKASIIKVTLSFTGSISSTGITSIDGKDLKFEAIANLITKENNVYDDDLYVGANAAFRIALRYLLLKFSGSFTTASEFEASDAVKKMTDATYNIDLTDLMATDISSILGTALTSSGTMNVRTFINLLFASGSIGSAFNTAITYLVNAKLMDTSTYLLVPSGMASLSSAILNLLYLKKADPKGTMTEEQKTTAKTTIGNTVSLLTDALVSNKEYLKTTTEDASTKFGFQSLIDLVALKTKDTSDKEISYLSYVLSNLKSLGFEQDQEKADDYTKLDLGYVASATVDSDKFLVGSSFGFIYSQSLSSDTTKNKSISIIFDGTYSKTIDFTVDEMMEGTSISLNNLIYALAAINS